MLKLKAERIERFNEEKAELEQDAKNDEENYLNEEVLEKADAIESDDTDDSQRSGFWKSYAFWTFWTLFRQFEFSMMLRAVKIPNRDSYFHLVLFRNWLKLFEVKPTWCSIDTDYKFHFCSIFLNAV